MKRNFSLIWKRFKGGPGDKVMMNPPKFSGPKDPYRQDPQPPHRFFTRPPPNKSSADAEFMEHQLENFEVGKRHLANMMGLDVNLMTQEDIDKCIQYLFPTALFGKWAKPIMKNPTELFPPVQDLDVDSNGRPRNPFFYTSRKQFATVCFAISHAIQEADIALKLGERPRRNLPFNVRDQQWVDKTALEKRMGNEIKDQDMLHFNLLIRRLVTHPLSANYESLIDQFRLRSQAKSIAQEEQDVMRGFLTQDPYDTVSIASGQKKQASAQVELRPCKDGEIPTISVNGLDLHEHFDLLQDREQVMFPLAVTKMYGKFHIKATVDGGGRSGQSNSVRLALARAMQPFLTPDLNEKLRLCGLLTRDPRAKERQKIAQHGARKKKRFRKR